jgi:hypothetical protein
MRADSPTRGRRVPYPSSQRCSMTSCTHPMRFAFAHRCEIPTAPQGAARQPASPMSPAGGRRHVINGGRGRREGDRCRWAAALACASNRVSRFRSKFWLAEPKLSNGSKRQGGPPSRLRRYGETAFAPNHERRLEAPPGFEPGMEVLQTSALPLGYGAVGRARVSDTWGLAGRRSTARLRGCAASARPPFA